MFVATLAEACGKHSWRIHAYVLMSNHYHLLLEAPEPNLVKAMSWLQGTYTARISARHKHFGNQTFGERLLKLADGTLKEKAGNLNYRGKEVRDHGEKRAMVIVSMGKGLRLTGLEGVDLDRIPKRDPRKALVALAVKRETGVPLQWIADQLAMGVTTGVNRYANKAHKEMASNPRNARLFENEKIVK